MYISTSSRAGTMSLNGKDYVAAGIVTLHGSLALVGSCLMHWTVAGAARQLSPN